MFPKTLYYENQDKGEVMLGIVVTKTSKTPTDWSIIPTDYTFSTSGYKNCQGDLTNDYKAYTLCYELVTGDKKLPEHCAFDWNWVDKSRLTDYHGTICVSWQSFCEFLEPRISARLPLTSLEPSMHLDGRSTMDPTSKKCRYTINGDNSLEAMTYSFHALGHDHRKFPYMGIEVKNAVSSKVSFEKNKIKVVSKVSSHLSATISSSTESGT